MDIISQIIVTNGGKSISKVTISVKKKGLRKPTKLFMGIVAPKEQWGSFLVFPLYEGEKLKLSTRSKNVKWTIVGVSNADGKDLPQMQNQVLLDGNSLSRCYP